MAVTRCEKCDSFIDLDYHCEAYREELDAQCICDGCMDSMAATGELLDAMRKVQNGKPFTAQQQEIIDQLTEESEEP